jgi:hypothetical protein
VIIRWHENVHNVATQKMAFDIFLEKNLQTIFEFCFFYLKQCKHTYLLNCAWWVVYYFWEMKQFIFSTLNAVVFSCYFGLEYSLYFEQRN